MKCSQFITRGVVFLAGMLGVFACGGLATAAPYNVTFPGGGNWQTLYVQGFSTSLGASANSASIGDAVLLDSFQFFKSGTADTASNIQLAILNNIFTNLTGLTTSSPAFVGLSTNTIASTASLNTGDAETFNFAPLPLVYGNNYAAVFVNVDGLGNITPVRVSALAANYVDDGTGTFHPIPNYGTESQFIYATSNFINAGFFNTFSFAGDANFTANLETVPEPSSLLLGIGGISLLGLAQRRRIFAVRK